MGNPAASSSADHFLQLRDVGVVIEDGPHQPPGRRSEGEHANRRLDGGGGDVVGQVGLLRASAPSACAQAAIVGVALGADPFGGDRHVLDGEALSAEESVDGSGTSTSNSRRQIRQRKCWCGAVFVS